jgi:preprotein translocase subunit SecB
MPQPAYSMLRVYLKDASLELPGAPQMFAGPLEPAASIDVGRTRADLESGVSPEGISFSVHEVTIRGTLRMDAGGKTVALAEAQVAGIFELREFADAGREEFLLLGAPSLLTPSLRMHLSDLLTRGTLPMLFLPELDWGAVPVGQPAAIEGGNQSALALA